jgi:mono/diheme cytochrome c family protein
MAAMPASSDILRCLATVGAFLACGQAMAQTAESLGAPPGDARRGQQVYMKQLCHTCHGTIGHGGERGSGPKIYPNPFPYQAFVMQVRKPRQVMPPYTEKNLSDQELADIYHYLFSAKPSPAVKDIPLLRDF